MLTIAIVTDIHNGPDVGTKKGTAAPTLLQKFVNFVHTEKPDLVIDMGDRVNHVSNAADSASLERISSIFKEITVPVMHIMGNHDIDFLTPEDNARILGCSFESHSEVRDGFTIIYWNADVHMDLETGFSMPDSDIEWLKQALEQASYPTIVISHVPLDNGSMNGHVNCDRHVKPQWGSYPIEQGERIRDVLERSGKVIFCINGHLHWNAYSCIDGIHYVTVPSLIDTFTNYPDPNSGWALVKLAPEQIDIEIFGETPMRYGLSPRKKDSHWISMFKDYSPVDMSAK